MKQKITMKVVEDFVAKHPDGKNIKGPDRTYTYFNHGADEKEVFDSDEEVRPGCLFGHIIAYLGGGPELVIEDRDILAQESLLSKKLNTNEKAIILMAQQLADRGNKWHNALEMAKSAH